jgi:DNA-binding CsgD family transcriptional regulator
VTASTPITAIELEVLDGVARGMTVPAIARGMGMPYDTAKRHLSHLYPKLGAVNAPHAVALAYQAGLFPLDVDDVRELICVQAERYRTRRSPSAEPKDGTG